MKVILKRVVSTTLDIYVFISKCIYKLYRNEGGTGQVYIQVI